MPFRPPKPDAPTRRFERPIIYHYPRSRSSYGAIRLLGACSLNPIVIDVTIDRLLPRDVERLMDNLGITHPRDFMRTNDPLYTELNLHDPALSREALIEAIIDHPRLMKRPIVELPYREKGQRKRDFVIAQPPQMLFTVISNESVEEALGLVPPRPPPEETEADRWVREWSQAEGQYKLDPEAFAELRAHLHDPSESYDFPEETDEMGEDDEPPFVDEEIHTTAGGDIDALEIQRFLQDEGLEDEFIIEPDQGERAEEGEEEEDDPEVTAKVNAVILEMARKAVEKEQALPANKKGKKGATRLTAEELAELFERITEVSPSPPRRRSGRRRLPVPPLATATNNEGH